MRVIDYLMHGLLLVLTIDLVGDYDASTRAFGLHVHDSDAWLIMFTWISRFTESPLGFPVGSLPIPAGRYIISFWKAILD